jgi:predicted HicB family RNase H-like nuclease
MSRAFSVRVSEDFPKRAKIEAALAGVPLGVLLEELLVKREKARSRMRSPLHRVSEDD